MHRLAFLLVPCLLLAGCNLPAPATDLPPTPSQAGPTLTLPAASQTPSVTPSTPSPSTTATQPAQSATPTPTPTLEPGFGSISGAISGYPYGNLPALTIVAFEQDPPYHYWYLILGAGNTAFLMDGYVSTGRYQVVAYDPLGNAGGCPELVQVRNEETVSCDLNNWGGVYPAKPAGVP